MQVITTEIVSELLGRLRRVESAIERSNISNRDVILEDIKYVKGKLSEIGVSLLFIERDKNG